MALAAVLQLHRLQAGVIAATEVEVRLGGDVGEAVELALAGAVLVLGELVGEDGLDLPLELVRGRQAPVL